jgi:hypothetical protein
MRRLKDPHILNLGTSWNVSTRLHSPAPEKEPPGFLGQGGGWMVSKATEPTTRPTVLDDSCILQDLFCVL